MAETIIEKKKWLVGVLYYGGIDREHDKSIKNVARLPSIANVMELHGCPYIDIGRSIIATHVLEHEDIGGVLFVDHDMVFEPQEAQKLIESAEVYQGVVGAAYSMRRPGQMIGGVDATKVPLDKKIVFFEGGEVLPANHLGMGLTAIPRSVFERLVHAANAEDDRRQNLLERLGKISRSNDDEFDALRADLEKALLPHDLPLLENGVMPGTKCRPFFSLLQLKGAYFGEDVSFCLRCQFAGIPVLLDTRVRVYHKGSYCYGLEDVGMEVPYLARLEVVHAENPQTKAPNFSKDPVLQAAYDARKDEPTPPPPPPADLPPSVDPLGETRAA